MMCRRATFMRGGDRIARRPEVVLEGYSPLKRSDLGNRVLSEIAAPHGKAAAQVVLRWPVATPSDTRRSVLPGA
jgi:diketogulonate reductase-like aldo/keto reductase